MSHTKREVFEKVRTVLVDTLGVDDDEITIEATIIGDLGADSVDVLDIQLRIEQQFQIDMSRNELDPTDILTDSKDTQDGKITEGGFAKLQQRLPLMDLSKFENVLIQDFGNLVTVQDICTYIEGRKIFESVKQILLEALGHLEEGDVKPHALIALDLGAESVDYLDIIFRLEKRFSIEIPRGHLFPEDIVFDQRFVEGNPDNQTRQRVTQAGLTELKRRMPYMDFSEFEKNPLLSKFGDIITVTSLVRYIKYRIENPDVA